MQILTRRLSLLLPLISFPTLILSAPAPPSSSASSSASISSNTLPSSSSLISSSSSALSSSIPSSSSASIPVTTAGYAPSALNYPIYSPLTDPSSIVSSPLYTSNDDSPPPPIRGSLGASILGPQNEAMQYGLPDFLAPPSTDEGSVANAKWPMALSHNRIQTGGWARQQNVDVMPIATDLAGVNMRLLPGAVRELHWHTTAEWSYMIKGSTRITAVNTDNQNYIADVHEGDLWYFPPGIPHSIQALNDTGTDGAEFLLVFDDGSFSEDDTLLITDWMAHVPKEVLSKNFQTDPSAFDHIPENELYIFPAPLPTSTNNDDNPTAPNGQVPNPFSFAMSQMSTTTLNGGSVKIVDSTIFNVSKTIAVAEVSVEPGAVRELHWHPTEPEWSFFLEGQARMTLFAGSSNARTFDYSAGDVGYVPPSFGHYVENIGNTTMKYLEIFKSDRYQDISLKQWLALTPPELVRAHLNLDMDLIQSLPKDKQVVVQGKQDQQ